MASQSLYRKHRPQQFGQVVAQDHVTTALRNAITEDRIGHAYLFSGPRGTGKTTTARLLAKALNCLDLGTSGEPCGVCENCTAIAVGTFYDLIELDAASNRGVEDMRGLIQSVHVGLGVHSKRKVYVIDEVHMLTADASNTLLKTLEEPPEHVVFVLATTDPQKVLPTIRSRTQHFEFTLFSREELIAHLADILDREGVKSDEEVLDLIANRAAGSSRDALSLLDQALALGGGQLDTAAVQTALGGAPFQQRLAVLQAAAAEDVAGALASLHEMLAQGHDVRRVTDELLRTLRDAFMIANARGRVPYEGTQEEAQALEALASSMGNAAIVRSIELFGQAIVDIRSQTVADPRLVLEVAVVRTARREARTTVETLLDRVERLERQLANGAAAAGGPASLTPATPPTATPAPAAPRTGAVLAPRTASTAKSSAAAAPAAAPAPEVDELTAAPTPPASAANLDIDSVIEAWPIVLGALKKPIAAAIQEAQPITVDNGSIVFGVSKMRFDATNKRFRAEASAIKEAFAAQLGFEPRFQLRVHEFDAPGALRSTASDEAPPPDPADDHDAPIDLDELVDAPDAAPPDPTARIIADLGAEVLDERPRE